MRPILVERIAPRLSLCLLLSIGLAAMLPRSAEAQVLKKLKDKAKETLLERAVMSSEELLATALRCVHDDSECIEKARAENKPVVLTDTAGTVLTNEEGKPITDPAELKGATAAATRDAGAQEIAGARDLPRPPLSDPDGPAGLERVLQEVEHLPQPLQDEILTIYREFSGAPAYHNLADPACLAVAYRDLRLGQPDPDRFIVSNAIWDFLQAYGPHPPCLDRERILEFYRVQVPRFDATVDLECAASFAANAYLETPRLDINHASKYVVPGITACRTGDLT